MSLAQPAARLPPRATSAAGCRASFLRPAGNTPPPPTLPPLQPAARSAPRPPPPPSSGPAAWPRARRLSFCARLAFPAVPRRTAQIDSRAPSNRSAGAAPPPRTTVRHPCSALLSRPRPQRTARASRSVLCAGSTAPAAVFYVGRPSATFLHQPLTQQNSRRAKNCDFTS
ncbi:formin-like protein 6 [Schistocerca americana]|uniref:formin-like protein 6 n=1 Tax=Schistocerca americana TaxID=7009 RepID=UPI001F4FEBEE|nr:formin-like protein 6 [Schistocerca americana]